VQGAHFSPLFSLHMVGRSSGTSEAILAEEYDNRGYFVTLGRIVYRACCATSYLLCHFSVTVHVHCKLLG
jgi:hypothetical protein